jgi:hypothetical protein
VNAAKLGIETPKRDDVEAIWLIIGESEYAARFANASDHLARIVPAQGPCFVLEAVKQP